MKNIQILAYVAALDCLMIYFFENAFSAVDSSAAVGTASVGFAWLGAAACFAAIASTARLARTGSVNFEMSSVILIAFVVYFVAKVFVDATDPRDFFGYTFGSTGGLIFAYLVGVVGAICLQGIWQPVLRGRMARSLVSFGLFSLFCVYVILLISGYAEITANLRSVNLLIVDTSGYQRNGNFLSLGFLLASLAVVGMVFTNKRLGWLDNKVLTFCSIAVYFVAAPMMMYEGQLLGSNSVVLFVIAVAVPTVAFILFGLRGKGVEGRRVSLAGLMGTGLIAALVLGGVAWGAISYFNIDIVHLRLFNFGQGGATPTSVASRIGILRADYMRQLDFDPLFGNMTVDRLTTGQGTYAHSLPLSLLTHLGVVGFGLFGWFLWLRTRELRRAKSWCGVIVGSEARQRNFQLFILLTLLAVVLVASLTTFFVWTPLWFALGLLTPPFSSFDRVEPGQHDTVVRW